MSTQHSTNKLSLTARIAAERLQLLFSWKEALDTPAAGKRRSHATARKQVDREIAKQRTLVQQEIELRGAELQRVFTADQQRPGNVVIEEKLGHLRHEIRQFGQVLKATRSSDLGGTITLPLEHYPVELGLDRNTSAFTLEREDFITLAVAAAFIAVSCFAIAWYNLWRENVVFHMERTSANRIAIHFRNDSNFTAHFYGPWPDSDAGLEDHPYGIRLLCRTEGEDGFQDCTSIRDAWGHQGAVISPLKPVPVEPGVRETIELYLPVLEKIYGNTIAEVRIECGNRRNQDGFRFEIALDKAPTSP